MKRKILLLIFAAAAAAAFAGDIQDEFIGKWSAESFVIEQEDGLLVSPNSEYSYPYLGITGVDFLDRSFIVLTVLDSEYRAFYEIESLDFDNYNILCTFKNGEEFLLKLVKISDGTWKYLCRIAEGSILKGPAEPAADVQTEPMVIENAMEVEPAEEAIMQSLYVGLMKRK